jgi:hypothetical protein
MIPGLRYAVINDPDRHGSFSILYPTPLPGNIWGVLAPIREHPWGALIPTVSGDLLSHALHGHPRELRNALGRPPLHRPKLLVLKDKLCMEHQKDLCVIRGPHCMPGSGKLPDCYVAPYEDIELRRLLTVIGKAWDEGRYVFVVEGDEFLVT